MQFFKMLLLSSVSVGVLCAQDMHSPKAAKYTLQHVNYYAEDFPPYTYLGADGQMTGLGVDILLNAYQRLNLHPPHLNFTSWDVAYLTTLISQQPSSAFVMTYSEDRAKRFALVGPLAAANNQVYCREGITIKDKNDLKYHVYSAESYTISVDLLRNAGVGMKNIYTYQTFPEVIAAIESKQAECTVLESAVYQWRVNHGVIDPNLLKPVYKISEGQYYYGFNKMTSPYALSLLQKALDDVTSDKVLMQQIRNKYGVIQ